MRRSIWSVCLLVGCAGYCPGGDDWAVGEAFSYSLEAGEEECFFVPNTESAGLQLRSHSELDTFGNVQIYDDEGEYLIGNGWCCVIPNDHWTLISGANVNRANHVLFSNGGEGGALTTSFEWYETASGASADDPAPFQSGASGWHANNISLDAGQALYFSLDVPAGQHRLIVDGMDWSDDKAPGHAKIFTDAADMEGSIVTSCTSELIDGGARYAAECDVNMPGGSALLQIEQAGDANDVLFSVRLEGPQG